MPANFPINSHNNEAQLGGRGVRAFLSHRSSEKPFVGEVAKFLGRSRVIFDAYEFNTGDDFHVAIRKAFERADLFVLFASKDALDSSWVQLEIDTAESRLEASALAKAVCHIIDDNLDQSELPEWMHKSLISKQTNPKLVALDIHRLLNEQLSLRRPQFFVGRSGSLDEAVDLISSKWSPIIVYGLPGIGRRRFLSEVARNHLSYSKQATIELRPGDELPELLLKIRIFLGISGADGAKEFVDTNAARPLADLVEELRGLLVAICNSATLPVLVDTGALTDEEGRISTGVELLFSSISDDSTVDLAIVTQRRIRARDGSPYPAVRLNELDSVSTQRLLRLLANHESIALTPEQAASLSIYVAGYPPAATFAIEEVKNYGINHVVQNQKAIVSFNSQVFVGQLTQDDRLGDRHQKVLQLLSAYSPIPIEIISSYLGHPTPEDLGDTIVTLIDLAFVVPDQLFYRISEPIKDTSYRLFNGLYVDHELIASLIEEYLDSNDNEENRLNLAQMLFRALKFSGKHHDSKFATGLASDFINITTQSYYDENYDIVLEYGPQAIAARPSNIDIRRFVAQALVRKERFDEARQHIDHMIALGALKEAYFVKGFLERRRRHHQEAIDAYEKSISYGRRGGAVHRELAQCYFENGDVKNALLHINEAEKLSPLNRFVVDLKCTIAMKVGDREEAGRCLRILETIDTGGFVAHRRSRFEASEGHFGEALKYAKKAVENSGRPSYEIMANLVNTYIECGEYVSASLALNQLDQRFGSTHRDARIGLRCKMELRQRNTSAAEGLWTRIEDKSLKVHRGLRANILSQKREFGIISPEEVAELSALEADPALFDYGFFDIFDGGDE